MIRSTTVGTAFRLSALILLGLLILAGPARAQSPVVITGRVVNDATPPVPIAKVIVGVENVFTESDSEGRFTLTLPSSQAPSVRVTTNAVGYMEQTVEAALANGRAAIEIVVHKNPAYHEEVEVTGRFTDVTTAPPATIVIDPVQVTRVAGSADNVFRVLQTMPGVSATDDFGSRLAVRGGGPDQNLTLMDGVEIHNPYRLFGLTSAFNPETIEKFELTAGGFSAKYGDRLSSILLVDNRPGTTRQTFAGSAAVSATDANVVFEGSLPAGSWLVTARRTYYDLLAARVTDQDLPSFADLQAKVAWEPKAGHQLTFFALGSRESTDASFDNNSRGDTIGLVDTSNNDVVSLTYSALLGNNATLKTIGALYRYRDVLGVDASVRNDGSRSNGPTDDAFARAAIEFTRRLTVNDISVREELAVAASPRQTINAGIEAHLLRTEWGWTITGDRNNSAANGSSVLGGSGLPDQLDSAADSPRVGGWFEDELTIVPRLRVVPGIRFDYTGLSDEMLVSPRLRATLDLTPKTRLRFATGRFTQSPGYEKLLQSDYFVDLSNTASIDLKSERAVHALAGVEHDFGDGLRARVEGYWKTFDHMIGGRLETPAETAARVAQYNFPAALASSVPTATQITTVPSNDGSGEAYGFDLYLEKRAQTIRDRLSGWISYTWGRATVDNYGYSYPFDYDRRHALSIVSRWRFAKMMTLSGTMRVASGFPFTEPIGLRVASIQAPNILPGAAGSLVPRYDTNGLPVWTVDYGGVENLNSGRLPLYARLDLRFTYMKSPLSRWELYAEGINVLQRDNAARVNPRLEYDPGSDRPRLSVEPDGGLPFFPSFGFRIRF